MLLNVASGKLLTTSVVSADGATCSQALQQIAASINDGDASNDEIAKDIGDDINNAKLVPAGVIDLGIQQVPYKTDRLTTVYRGVGPSPARGATNVRFDLAESRAVDVKVYAVNGRLVREMRRTLDAGRHVLTWDLRDGHGARVPAGVYFVQVNLGTQRHVGRVVLLP
jgi:FlgD Ig-like domain